MVDSNGFVTLSGSGSAIMFDADVGTATPAANIINFKGTSSQGISSSASGNTVTYTIADATYTQLGVASFNSTEFTVTSGAVTSNNFTITAGTGLSGGGSLTLGGSVTLSAGGTIATTYTANTGSATPSGNNLDILGDYILAGSGDPVITTASGSTLIVNVQLSEAAGSSSANSAGICSFSSTDFSVDSNGYVTLTGSGSEITFTGDSGTPFTTGSVTITGGTTGLTFAAATPDLTLGGTLKLANGGTNANLTASNGGIFYSTASAGAILSGTATAHQLLLSGASTAPLWSTSTYPTTNAINTLLYASSANVMAALATADNAVLTSTAAGVPTWEALTDGQVIIGSSAGAPAAATLTAGTGISITNGHNSISIAVNGAVVGETITGNSGGALSPTAGNWNILGTGSITTVGSVSTLTVELTGLTNHALQVGAGTATLTQLGAGTTGQVLQTNTGADPTWSTATYPSTTTINQILYSSSANVVAGLATANNGVLTTGTTGIPVVTALASNGQIIIGSGSGAPVAATLTAGPGVSITNAANSITISATAAAFAYTNVNHAASPYTVLVGDQYISVDCSGGVVSLLFPNVPTALRTWVIKDRTGSASTSNISITTVGGSVTIDGQTTYKITSNYGAINLLANATPTYEVY